jgi:hypothetical protein
MTDNMLVRMGDGERVTMSADQVKEDLEAGTRDAHPVRKLLLPMMPCVPCFISIRTTAVRASP